MLSTGPKSLPHELDFLVWTGLLGDFAERSSYIVRPEEEDMFRGSVTVPVAAAIVNVEGERSATAAQLHKTQGGNSIEKHLA